MASRTPTLGIAMKTRSLIAISVLAASLAAVPPAPTALAAEPSIDAFQGLGAWVDIYDPQAWRDPEGIVAALDAHGVRTLFLETTNYRRRGPLYFRRGTDRFLAAAHAAGMKVVGWYLPGFKNLKRDRHRSVAAIRYVSPEGERFDAFALDIEATIVKKYWVRSARLLKLSQQIRSAAGPDYTLGAIHYSPRGLELSPKTWPAFPYRKLAAFYDVFMPMTYYSYRAKGPRAVHDYLARSLDILRKRTKGLGVAIHPIGGIADGSSFKEGQAFVRAAREYGVVGASMYDASIMNDADWLAVEPVVPLPVPSPPMPLTPWKHTDAYGNIPAGDTSHPAEVVFKTGGLPGNREIDFDAHNIGMDEVDLYMNWKLVGALPAAPTGRQWMSIPDAFLKDTEDNVIAFVPRNRVSPGPWGIGGVTISPAPLPLTDLEGHGALPGAGTTWADRVSYTFESNGTAITVTVQGYDIGAGEVKVTLNGVPTAPLSELATGPPGDWGASQAFSLTPVAGTNRLTFDSVPNPPARDPWGVRIVSST